MVRANALYIESPMFVGSLAPSEGACVCMCVGLRVCTCS